MFVGVEDKRAIEECSDVEVGREGAELVVLLGMREARYSGWGMCGRHGGP